MENNVLNNYSEENQELDEIEKAEKEYNSNNDLNRLDVNYYTVERTIENLLKWIKNNKLEIPDFQRDYVWDYEKASLLVDSVLTNLPIPNVFVYREIVNQKERYILIDGKQRLTTFQFFVDGEFPNKNKKNKEFCVIDNKNASWYRKTYDNLELDDKEAFNEYNIKLTVFESQKEVDEQEKNKVMYQIFKRVNTGADELKPQEIRNAVYNDNCILKSIREYTSDNNCDYYKLIKNDDVVLQRYKYQEVFLRFLTYYNIYKDYKNKKENKNLSKQDAINDYLDKLILDDVVFNQQFECVKRALSAIYNYDETALYNVKRTKNGIGNRVHETFAEGLVIALIENEFKINTTKENFYNKKINIWNDENKKKYFVSNTLSIEHIQQRIEILKDIINGK